ncbi:MAG: FHA domain-containing protein [Anaerolineae bacterium]|nr:FHA domain-containing protein [Anaerolineae bacterium]
MAKLVIYEEIDGAETVFEDFELSIDRILVGSGPDNHLVLDAPEIDSAHASLELRNDHWILQDLGGPGGTFVNNKNIEGPYRLQHNDLITVGRIKMRFVDEGWAVEIEQEEVFSEEEMAEDNNAPISGRIWFATLAGGTLAVIFIILLLLVVADFLGVIKITDLLPWL